MVQSEKWTAMRETFLFVENTEYARSHKESGHHAYSLHFALPEYNVSTLGGVFLTPEYSTFTWAGKIGLHESAEVAFRTLPRKLFPTVNHEGFPTFPYRSVISLITDGEEPSVHEYTIQNSGDYREYLSHIRILSDVSFARYDIQLFANRPDMNFSFSTESTSEPPNAVSLAVQIARTAVWKPYFVQWALLSKSVLRHRKITSHDIESLTQQLNEIAPRVLR